MVRQYSGVNAGFDHDFLVLRKGRERLYFKKWVLWLEGSISGPRALIEVLAGEESVVLCCPDRVDRMSELG